MLWPDPCGGTAAQENRRYPDAPSRPPRTVGGLLAPRGGSWHARCTTGHMEMLVPPVIVIVLAAFVVDGTRAYRALPAALNRLRRWRRARKAA